jgi:nitrogen-specific signal transduction histidine kinase/ActR/RegA family two-component response regulator
MKTANVKSRAHLFSGTAIFATLLGAILLIGLSFVQKVAAGFNPYLWKAYSIPTLFGGFCGLTIGIYIRKLKHSARALSESELKYRAMMESMADAIYICSSDFKIEYLNPAMVQRIGRDAVSETCYAVLHEFDEICPWCCHQQAMKGGNTNLEITSPKDNKTYLISSSPICHADGSVSKLTVYRDISDQKRLQEQLQQARKMEAIGTLAGGIAHDFNNILSGIIGYTELALIDSKDCPSTKNKLGQVLEGCSRATELVKQILSFSRNQKGEVKPISPASITKEVLKLMRASLPSTIEIKQSIDSESYVQADATKIHQVLMNLCTNAALAMKQKGGVLSVRLQDVALDQDDLFHHPGILAGEYLKISVEDTGISMPKEIQERAFDPFFTTKELGNGTGMGLAIVHGIITELSGFVSLYSKPDQGTAVHVLIPSIAKPAEIENSFNNEPLKGGTERILFADDDQIQIDLAKDALSRYGYQVTAFSDSTIALVHFQQDPDAYDLVITDMTMPKMTGDILVQKIHLKRPDIPVIMCTGFSENMNEQKANALEIKAFLYKPVVMANLLETIRRVLDQDM